MDETLVLLRLRAVMEAVGCSQSHILREIHSGRLRAINIGRGERRAEWRIRPEDLRAYIRTLSVPTGGVQR